MIAIDTVLAEAFYKCPLGAKKKECPFREVQLLDSFWLKIKWWESKTDEEQKSLSLAHKQCFWINKETQKTAI